MTDVTDDDMELVYGSGNIFRDFNVPDANALQLKALLGVEIMKTLKGRKLTVRQAHAETGFAANDFSAIRNARFSRFTIDRLLKILHSLDKDVEVSMSIHHRPGTGAAMPAAIHPG
jgi:predicted XRE-type DNA-binding protein